MLCSIATARWSTAPACWGDGPCSARAGLTAPDPQIVRRVVGLSLPVAVRQLAPDLPDEQARAVTEFYRSSFRARREEGLLDEPLYDGIAELLGGLHAAGWSLAVATGKPDRERAVRGQLGLLHRTPDRRPPRPHPLPPCSKPRCSKLARCPRKR